MDLSVNSDVIDGEFLEKIRADLRAVREAKFTSNLRFHYTDIRVRSIPINSLLNIHHEIALRSRHWL